MQRAFPISIEMRSRKTPREPAAAEAAGAPSARRKAVPQLQLALRAVWEEAEPQRRKYFCASPNIPACEAFRADRAEDSVLARREVRISCRPQARLKDRSPSF